MRKSERATQVRRELDRKFAATNLEPVLARPRGGWIRAIRTGLGMSQEALARRLGVTTANITKLEGSERSETISIGRLADVARAMDCQLVYALVPNTSLEEMVDAHAREIATRELNRVAHTMRLEAQETDDADFEARVHAYIRDRLSERDLWDRR